MTKQINSKEKKTISAIPCEPAVSEKVLDIITCLRSKQRECRELRRPGGVACPLSTEVWAD